MTFHTNPASATAQPARELTLSGLARECMRDSGGDIIQAAAFMRARLVSDEALIGVLVDEAIRQASYDMARKDQRDTRASIVRVAMQPPKTSLAGLPDYGRKLLLNFVLPKGPPLRDATREQVGEAAARYTKQARTMGHFGRWLSAIHKDMPENRTVEAVFSEGTLRKIFKDTANA